MKCFGCDEKASLKEWCLSCWEEFPEDIRETLAIAKTEPFASSVKSAAGYFLRTKRWIAVQRKPKLNLEDLKI